MKKSSNKRLLFDRRYGWIYDDWREPSKEALTGGRGLFCILPLGKSALHMASQWLLRKTNKFRAKFGFFLTIGIALSMNIVYQIVVAVELLIQKTQNVFE